MGESSGRAGGRVGGVGSVVRFDQAKGKKNNINPAPIGGEDANGNPIIHGSSGATVMIAGVDDIGDSIGHKRNPFPS